MINLPTLINLRFNYTFKVTIFSALLFLIFFSSCSDEDIFLDAVIPDEEVIQDGDIEGDGSDEEDENSETPTDNTTTDPETGKSELGEINQTPCDFNLDNLSPGDVLSIDCKLDLNGQTVLLPRDVTLEFKGGEIVNGTLQFNDGIIDGKLLNHTLNIIGTADLMETEFFFYPERWDIVQGKTNDGNALNNRLNIQKAIDMSKNLKATIFSIDKLDAYFAIGKEWQNSAGYDRLSISIPSNFHFKMSESTFLRVQPNNWPRGLLVSVYIRENVLITGGNIIGDRYEHDYSPINDELGLPRNTHEWPALMIVSGSENVTVDGVYMANATGDAFIAGAAAGFRTDPNNPFNKNIVARNCTMTASRRNNISITDGEDILIENCVISEAGNGDNELNGNGDIIYSSAGVAPKVGIDIEPFRGYTSNGESVNYEKVEGVVIRGCTFTNNNVASIIDYSGKDVIMENNISDHGFFASYSTGTQFLNNTFKASSRHRDKAAITTGNWIVAINGVDTQLSEDNVVRGNTIEGFRVGIITQGKNGVIQNNDITDFEYGIQVKGTENFQFSNNSMISSREVWSLGISIANTFAKNLTFTGQNIKTPRKPMELYNVNNQAEFTNYSLYFTNSTFESLQGYAILVKDTPNVEISNSQLINTDISLENSINFIQSNNTKQ